MIKSSIVYKYYHHHHHHHRRLGGCDGLATAATTAAAATAWRSGGVAWRGGEFVYTIWVAAGVGLAGGEFLGVRGVLSAPKWTEFFAPSVFKIYSYAHRKYQKSEKPLVNHWTETNPKPPHQLPK